MEWPARPPPVGGGGVSVCMTSQGVFGALHVIILISLN